MGPIKLSLWMWFMWAALLIFQNAGNTWITRARAGKSLRQHALATVITQLIGFVGGFFAFDNMIRIIQEHNWPLAFTILAFYTCCNLIGGTGSHAVLLRIDARKKK